MRTFWVIPLLVGCSGDPAPDPGDDDDDGEELTATGVWTGDCAGTWQETSPTTYYEVSFAISLDLTDEGGDVTGIITFVDFTTYEPLPLSGTLEGDALELEAEIDDTSGYRFHLTLDGDSASGQWELFSTVSEVQDPLDCEFER